MATYIELVNLENNSVLRAKTRLALIIAAKSIRAETPPIDAQRARWANRVLRDPDQEVPRALRLVLADELATPVAGIQAASDAAVQTRVDASVDLLVMDA